MVSSVATPGFQTHASMLAVASTPVIPAGASSRSPPAAVNNCRKSVPSMRMPLVPLVAVGTGWPMTGIVVGSPLLDSKTPPSEPVLGMSFASPAGSAVASTLTSRFSATAMAKSVRDSSC
jgi:hypothetical protein